MPTLRSLVLLASFAALICGNARARQTPHPVPESTRWLTYAGTSGPGVGRHVVLIAADQEYRSEQALPMLARLLAERHGFRCTVLFLVNEKGESDPTLPIRHQDDSVVHHIPGLEHLKTADLVVLFNRLITLSDEQVALVIDYLDSGKPLIGIRTANHGFLANFPYELDGRRVRFGDDVLGGAFRAHHGGWHQESTRGIIVQQNAGHPILKGVRDVWGPSDVYRVHDEGERLGADCTALLLGQPLVGLQPDDAPNEEKKALPIAWTKSWTGRTGKTARVFHVTMGSARDYQSEGLRRLTVNAVYWCLGMEDRISEDRSCDPVGPYAPRASGFDYEKIGVRPRVVSAYDTRTRSLFNGKDLTGWHADVPAADGDADVAPSFVARDGLLVSKGKPEGHLITDAIHEDYRLEVEYRFPADAGNCGVLVHASKPRALYGMFPQSIEVQMQSGHAGDFWCIAENIAVLDMAKRRRGASESWGGGEKDSRNIKNLTDDSERPLGEWNRMVIECLDRRVRVWVNDDLVNDGFQATAPRGQIAVQAEGTEVEFRRLDLTSITELSESPPPPPAQDEPTTETGRVAPGRDGTPIAFASSYELPSEILGQTRRINVYLPRGYEESDARYPVLYLLDGGMKEDFLHVAGLASLAADFRQIREFILVGIEGIDRYHDLTPPTANEEDARRLPQSGGAAKFRRFLAEELRPFIEGGLRTTEETALIGESVAGLFVAETLLRQPKLFAAYVCVSPSLWWNGMSLARESAALLEQHRDQLAGRRVFLAIGSESGDMRVAFDQLASSLRAHAASGIELIHRPMPQESHGTIFHPAALDAIRTLFATPAEKDGP